MKQASSYGRKIENNMSREVTHLQIVKKKIFGNPCGRGSFFLALVRPHLKCCVQLRAPWYGINMAILEGEELCWLGYPVKSCKDDGQMENRARLSSAVTGPEAVRHRRFLLNIRKHFYPL